MWTPVHLRAKDSDLLCTPTPVTVYRRGGRISTSCGHAAPGSQHCAQATPLSAAQQVGRDNVQAKSRGPAHSSWGGGGATAPSVLKRRVSAVTAGVALPSERPSDVLRNEVQALLATWPLGDLQEPALSNEAPRGRPNLHPRAPPTCSVCTHRAPAADHTGQKTGKVSTRHWVFQAPDEDICANLVFSDHLTTHQVSWVNGEHQGLSTKSLPVLLKVIFCSEFKWTL